MIRRPPRSPPFPYTTLCRSVDGLYGLFLPDAPDDDEQDPAGERRGRPVHEVHGEHEEHHREDREGEKHHLTPPHPIGILPLDRRPHTSKRCGPRPAVLVDAFYGGVEVETVDDADDEPG